MAEAQQYRVALIYGPAGTRKSSLANSGPRPLTVLAFDGGYRRSKFVQSNRLEEPTTWEQVVDYTANVDGGTVVVDTCGKMIALLKIHAKKKSPKNRARDGAITQAGWGTVGDTFIDWFEDIRLRANVIFVAHDTTSADDMKKIVPAMQGNMVKDAIIGECTLIGWTYPMSGIEGEAPKYGVTWMSADDRPHAKGDFLGAQLINGSPLQMAHNLAAALEDEQKNAQESADESDALNELLDRIAAAGLDDLTKIAEDLKVAGPMAKALARPAFKHRINELDARFDKKAGRYVLASAPDADEKPAPKKAKKKAKAGARKKAKAEKAAAEKAAKVEKDAKAAAAAKRSAAAKKAAATRKANAAKKAAAEKAKAEAAKDRADSSDSNEAPEPAEPQDQPDGDDPWDNPEAGAEYDAKEAAANDLAEGFVAMLGKAVTANSLTYLRGEIAEKLGADVPNSLRVAFRDRVRELDCRWDADEERYVQKAPPAQRSLS